MSKGATVRGRQAILTGERGENAISDLFLSWDWHARPQKLDQGIDLSVESTIDGVGTGNHYFVQCKASADARASASGFPIVIKANTLDYLKRQTSPVVFMFAVVDGAEVYWATLAEVVRGATRRRDGSVRFNVPLREPFLLRADAQRKAADCARFLARIGREDPLLQRLQMQARIDVEERRLSAIDRRLDLEIVLSSSTTTYQVQTRPGESLQINFKVPDFADQRRLKDSVEFGSPSEVSVEAFRVDSDLINQVFNPRQSGVLRVQGEQVGHMRFRFSDAQRQAASKTLRFRGDIYRGRAGASVVGVAPGHPLQATFRATASTPDEQASLKVALVYSADRWAGKELLPLDRLESAAKSLEALAAAEHLKVEIEIDGDEDETTQEFQNTLAQREEMQHSAEILRDLDALRELAQRYAPTLRIGRFSEGSFHEATWWRHARALLTGAEIEGSPEGLSALVPKMDDSTRSALAKSSDAHFMAITSSPLDITAFGQPLCQIPVDILMRHFSVSLEDHFDGSTTIRFVPTEQSSVRLRRSSGSALPTEWEKVLRE